MKKVVKIIVIVLIVLGIVGGVVYTMTAPITVPLSHISSKDIDLSFSEQGLAVAENIVQVYSAAQGQVLKVLAHENQSVRYGDVICIVDSGPLILRLDELGSISKGYEAQYANLEIEQERARSDLQSNKVRLEAEIDALDAQSRSSSRTLQQQNASVNEQLRLQDTLIEQSAKDLNRAREDLEKANLLYQAGTITQNEYNSSERLVEKSEEALETAKQTRGVIASGKSVNSNEYYEGAKAVIVAQIEGINQSLKADYTGAMKEYYDALIQGNKANVAQIERQIADCTVTATADGIITKLNVKSMNYVSSATPIAEITIPSNVIETFVSTHDVDSVKAGDSVELTLKRREGDTVFSGYVLDIGSMAEIKLSTLGVEERKVKIRIDPNLSELANASFGMGYSVDVKFFVYRAENKLVVPKTALFKDEGADKLWIIRDGVAEAISVTAGMELRTETVIEAGIVEGDYVVTDANNKDLRNGVKVSIENA